MERDFVGYGAQPPRVSWPGGARVAVSLVVNYEEGSERSWAFGDTEQEPYREYPVHLPEGVRDTGMESFYEYGSRAGFWRILRILKKHGVPATFFCCAVALERNPAAARAIVADGHEVCGHGYRWEHHYTMEEAYERERLRQAVQSMQMTTGERPRGWYSRYAPSPHTRRLLMEEGGFEYDCDSYADDLPYYVREGGRPWLVVPYTLETNDVKFWTNAAFANSDDFFQYMRDSLDVLHEEGAEAPKMMSVGLHLRITGRPGRAAALDRFLAYARDLGDVWFARRLDIARHWREHHPPA